MKKQDTQKLFSLKEWHLPGYNWNGAFTKVSERLSLNYKGKVGTSSYFLPINKIDKEAFEHDLFYFSPNSISRAYADIKYIRQLGPPKKLLGTKQISLSVIGSLWAWRMAQLPIAVKLLIKTSQLTAYLDDIRKVLATKPTNIMGPLFNPKTGVMPDIIKQKADQWFKITGSARGRAVKSYKRIWLNRIIPLIIAHGSGYFTKPISDISQITMQLINSFKKSDEFKILEKENKKVVQKYNKYLAQVGKFDKDGNYNINKNIDGKKARETYIDFFKQYQDYLKSVNELYNDYPDFKNIKIPELNEKEFYKVSNPTMTEPPEIVTEFKPIKESSPNKWLQKFNKQIDDIKLIAPPPEKDKIKIDEPIKETPVIEDFEDKKDEPIKETPIIEDYEDKKDIVKLPTEETEEIVKVLGAEQPEPLTSHKELEVYTIITQDDDGNDIYMHYYL